MEKKVAVFLAILILLASFLMVGCASTEEEDILHPVITPIEFWFPENLKCLTEGEKNKAVEITLNTPGALEWRQKESQYNTEISWAALYPDPSGEGYSGYRHYEYEIVETGILIYPPERIVSIGGGQKDAEIYPEVTIRFGEPIKWIVSVAINLDEEKVVYTDEYPARYGPTRPEEAD